MKTAQRPEAELSQLLKNSHDSLSVGLNPSRAQYRPRTVSLSAGAVCAIDSKALRQSDNETYFPNTGEAENSLDLSVGVSSLSAPLTLPNVPVPIYTAGCISHILRVVNAASRSGLKVLGATGCLLIFCLQHLFQPLRKGWVA